MTRSENVSLAKIDIRFAVARSHLQLREFNNDALCIYHELEKGPTVNSTHHRAELVKGTAQSYEGLGLIEKASTTYQRFLCSSCSKQNSSREIALMKLKLARLKIKLYQLDEALIDMLFDVLRDLLADAGFSKKYVQCRVLNKFPDFKYAQRLQFLSNPTRELAHCVCTISELFKMSGEADLAQMYRAKARKFGLLMVADEDNDTETKVTILHDAGRKFGSLQYLKYAQQLLYEDSSETPRKKELAAEVCLSSGELYAKLGEKGREELETLSEDVMLQERFNPVGEFDYEDWRTEAEDCLTKLGRDENHYDYGKLNKISGDVLSRRVKAQKQISYSLMSRLCLVLKKLRLYYSSGRSMKPILLIILILFCLSTPHQYGNFQGQHLINYKNRWSTRRIIIKYTHLVLPLNLTRIELLGFLFLHG